MLPSGVRAAVKPKAFRNIQIMLGLFLWLGIQSQAYSQVLYGSIVGTVTDPSGAVVPGAVVHGDGHWNRADADGHHRPEWTLQYCEPFARHL